MVIGFDASRAFIGKRTGTENYSYQILNHLIKLDQNSKYYIYIRHNLDNRRLKIEDGNLKIEDRGLNENNLSSTLYSQKSIFYSPSSIVKVIPFPRLWTQAGLALRTFIDPLDVLFIPAHTLPLIRKPGLKTVVTVHDLGAEYLPNTHQLKQRLYLNYMTHHQLKSATHLIAVSEATKQDLINKVGILSDKISVVYEGYNQELYRPIRGTLLHQTLKKYNLEDHEYFLFVGTIQPRKNLFRLITAYSEFLKSYHSIENEGFGTSSKYYVLREEDKNKKPVIRNTNPPSLILAGSKGWLSNEIYELPKKLGIEDKVKFLGYVPDKQMPALYSGAQAFLYPSLFEGFGLPILEAMACGCPVLTSNVSSCPEAAGEAAILVDPTSVEEIFQGILHLTKNRELTNQLTKSGFEQIKKFSWEKAASQTLAILEQVVSRK